MLNKLIKQEYSEKLNNEKVDDDQKDSKNVINDLNILVDQKNELITSLEKRNKELEDKYEIVSNEKKILLSTLDQFRMIFSSFFNQKANPEISDNYDQTLGLLRKPKSD